ncbi:threonine/homoserine/homoserine lactone efflux protein [Murinocardiopsis flavida]|uniref:Threonine/homoserine/homoserine lactone efflux protein n=1 Tax=Murinocardiopsis flavida TaxID=645275 RepID=A0A2P8DP14_9ACTN|nr:LysE family translocator [Murinocardiopsis flavida]PSK98955.1 threonine/homoserine/homoserine lactone efflux protein [Murinocardiopsis flavida]
MPQPHVLALFTAAAIALIVVPGPNLLYILTRSVSQGRRAGVISAFGVETGTLVHVAAAAIGLSSLLATSAVAFDIVRYAGAAYLVYLGVRALADRAPLDLGTEAAPPRALARVFRDGMLVNVFNPKVALFFLAFLPQFVDPAAGPPAMQILVFGAIMASLGLAMDLTFAFGGGAVSAWLRRRPAIASRQRFAVGGVYLSMGAAAALSGRH